MDGDDASRMAAGEQPYYTDPPVPQLPLVDSPAYHLSTVMRMLERYSRLARVVFTQQPSTMDAIDESDAGMVGLGAVSGETREMNQEGYSGDRQTMHDRAAEETAGQLGGMDTIDDGDDEDVAHRRAVPLSLYRFTPQHVYLTMHMGQRYSGDDGQTIGEDDAYTNGGIGAIPASSGAIAGLAEATVGGTREKRCGVCLEDIDREDKLRKMPCSHCFHESCIFNWLRVSRVCPYCRFPLPAAELL